MTHLFSSLFTCVLTLLRANHHYSQHQSLWEHGDSSSLWLSPIYDEKKGKQRSQVNGNLSRGSENCV